MVLAQVVCNVRIQLVNVPAMLVTKAPHVMLLVVAIRLVQAVEHVMLLLVNVLVRLVIQVPNVIPVRQITIEQVMELAQVSLIMTPVILSFFFNVWIFFSLWLLWYWFKFRLV